MNARQEKIIELLRESGGWMKGKDIALVMGVSTRKIGRASCRERV